MRRGFTLIEMLIALSISAVILTAIVGMLTSVWMMAKETSDEVQCALSARAIRERLFYSLMDDSGATLGYGLISATNIVFSATSGMTAYPADGAKPHWTVDFNDSADQKHFSFDKSKNKLGDYRNGEALQYVYLMCESGTKGNRGYVAYYDRLVVPVFGRGQRIVDADAARTEFVRAIGGDNWNP